MDSARFDRLIRSLTPARSRRRVLVTVVGGALGLLGLADAAAKHGKGKRKHKRKKTGEPVPAYAFLR